MSTVPIYDDFNFPNPATCAICDVDVPIVMAPSDMADSP